MHKTLWNHFSPSLSILLSNDTIGWTNLNLKRTFSVGFSLLPACSLYWRQHQVNHKKIVLVGEIVSAIIMSTAALLQFSQLGCCPWMSLFTVGSVFCSHEFWGPTEPSQSVNVLMMQLEHFNCYHHLFRVALEWWRWCTVSHQADQIRLALTLIQPHLISLHIWFNHSLLASLFYFISSLIYMWKGATNL